MVPDTERPALKAILFADMAQYSRLTAAGELATLELVTRCFALFEEHCRSYRGEFIKTTGDGVLIVFDGVSDAIDFAMTIQERLAALAEHFPAADRFRIGVHTGEVRRRGGDIYGHAVNVAARVETLGESGGVCVTQDVYRAVRSITRYGFRFAGRRALKNIPEMVTLYQVTPFGASAMKLAADQFFITVIDGLAILSADGEPVTMRSRPAQALIGYLALSNDFGEFQDRIAALLWPDRVTTEARHALHNCLRIVSKALVGGAHNGGLRRGNYISFDKSRLVVDVNRILSDLSAGKIDESLLRRPDWAEAILYGFENINHLYAAWLRVTRHNRRDRAQEGLEELIGRFNPEETVVRNAATALLLLDPSHESAARALMRHHAANHNIAAAMRVFERLAETLRERYRLDPSPETALLTANLTEPVAAREHVKPPRPRMPVIAVDTFIAANANISAFAAGFRSELIVNLSRFRELTVIDLQKGSDGGDTEYVIKAECTGNGAEVHLFVSLEEPGRQRIVWSNSYQVSLANWLDVQKHLVGRIASTLEIYLSHDRLGRALLRLPEDLSVYDAWLRGEHLLLRWSASSEDEAEKLFEQAIAQDPNFAPAHASLASIYNSRHMIRPGSRREPETQHRALELARRAVELDPLDARNQMVVAWSAAMMQSFDRAEFHYELACDLNPNDPKILVSAALGLAFMGRIEPAMKFLQHSLRLTSLFPDYQWSHISTTRYLAGDYAGAIEAADRSKNLIIDTPGWKAAALRKLGHHDESQAALVQLQQSVTTAWAGPTSPSREDVRAWFLSAFPLRRETDRQDLARVFTEPLIA